MKMRFKKIFIEISGACNLSCPFCPAQTQKTKPHMSLELFEKIIWQTKSLTERHSLHILGEPLLYPQFPELLKIAGKHKIKIEITSNGLLLENYLPELFSCSALKQLNLSLHSLSSHLGTEKTFEFLRTLLPSLEILIDRLPELYINLRFWRDRNQDEELLAKLLQHYGNVDFIQKEKNIRLRERLLIHFEKGFDWPDSDGPVLQTTGHCHGLSSHFGILSDGTVIPCCLDYKGEIKLGNANSETLENILNSKRAQDLVEGFSKNELIENLCKRCQYIERFR